MVYELKKNRVALVRCDDYTQKSVNKAVEKGLELIGGVAALIKSGEKILLKPNILTGVPPEKCVTTHPAVFSAVAGAFQNAGAVLSYGDSPASDKPEKAARLSGITAAAEELGIAMADFSRGRNVFYEDGLQPRSFLIAEALFNCDGLISLPKLKTHGLEKLTLCVKNQFGCVPGISKAEFHVKLPDAMDFAAFLLDLNKYISPRLYVVDGIEGMEGNGPHGGTPRKMNFLLFASDPIAADAVICRIVGLDPMLLPTVMLSEDYVNKLAEIELVGDPVEEFICSDFKMDRGGPFSLRFLRHAAFLRPFLLSRPVIKRELCVKCGKCAEICPVKPKALTLPEGDFPLYDYSLCIRCYCCQEICPKKAVELQKPFLRKLFF
jgi:uncharacterized protein (DUF362 family)/Pyruvate/2-oxoacid:ferredoxin oxidoreductase delta subunit